MIFCTHSPLEYETKGAGMWYAADGEITDFKKSRLDAYYIENLELKSFD